jgi:AcrR family transcriptional regulator
MEAVAQASEVSRATLYRDYTSREHLLADVTLHAGRTLAKSLEQFPPPGRTVGKRVEALCKQLVRTASENELFLATCINNLASEDPAVLDAYDEIEALVTELLQSVLGDLSLKPGAIPTGIIFRYLFGGFLLATTGKMTFEQLADELVDACQRLLGEVWAKDLD